MTNNLKYLIIHGHELNKQLQDLAKLRITVFREYPYLYDGSIEYENKYLNTYAKCKDSVIALVYDNNKLVAATTSLPLSS